MSLISLRTNQEKGGINAELSWQKILEIITQSIQLYETLQLLAFRAVQMVGGHPEPPDYILPSVTVGYLKLKITVIIIFH